MAATYTQQTQMPITTSTSLSVQTDTQTFNNSTTQTDTFRICQTTQATQTYLQQSSKAIQTYHMLNEILPSDSTDSSTSTDFSDEEVMPINQFNSNNKKKIHTENFSSAKQRKKVISLEDQKITSQPLVNDIPMTETASIYETYEKHLETFQTSHTSFENLATNSETIN